MTGFEETTEVISDASGYVPDISVGFSNIINSIMVWFNKITWFEWVIILFIVVLIIILVGLRAKLKQNKRTITRFY